MKTIECSVVVDENNKAELQLPPEIAPGEHRLVVIIDEETLKPMDDPLGGLPTVRGEGWLEGVSLRREDMYDNDGR